jgi:hypothetical protein
LACRFLGRCDPPRLVLRQHLGLECLGFGVLRAEVKKRLPVGAVSLASLMSCMAYHQRGRSQSGGRETGPEHLNGARPTASEPQNSTPVDR